MQCLIKTHLGFINLLPLASVITICHLETLRFCCGYILNELLGDLEAVN